MPTLVASDKLYANSVNPQWVRLLEVLQMNVPFAHCEGAELFRSDGKRVLDFLSGYCVHNTGHNHPRIIAALKEELDRRGPVMLQSNVPELAGELAERLCESAGGRLKKAHFTNSGSEGVEAAIKFARARTGRDGLVYTDGAFHGLTCGALSLMGNDFWREGFGPLLPGARQVPFGDLKDLEAALSTKQCAAFIVETIQGEGGIRIPDASSICSRHRRSAEEYGSLFILDEVQTGMYRTGRFLAAQHFGLDPDMVILAKALSGGLVPVGAVLITDEVYDSVYSSLHRAIIHTSTFSENTLAMRAGLATLDVLETDRLGARATSLGQYLRRRLQDTLAHYEMVKEVRCQGLFCGIEFQAPRQWALRASYEAFKRIHAGMFGQMLVMSLFRKGILTQICGNNFQVLKVAPPLVVTEAQIDEFVNKMGEVVESIHSSAAFWTEALGLARRVVNI